MQVVSLSSGSHGNACVVQTPHGALVVDAGLPLKTLLARCMSMGTRPEDICGVVLTHEHGDHTTSVVSLARRLRVPIYTMPQTAACLTLPDGVEWVALQPGEKVVCAHIGIEAWPVSHDAVAPIAVRIQSNHHIVAIATDLGEWDHALADFLRPADLVVIEANHDRERLRLSRYDAQLKLRIASKTGHLDNMQAGALLSEIARDGRMRDAWLAHLSQEANSPALAVRSVTNVLALQQRTHTYRSIQALPRHTQLVWGPIQRTTQQTLWGED